MAGALGQSSGQVPAGPSHLRTLGVMVLRSVASQDQLLQGLALILGRVHLRGSTSHEWSMNGVLESHLGLKFAPLFSSQVTLGRLPNYCELRYLICKQPIVL